MVEFCIGGLVFLFFINYLGIFFVFFEGCVIYFNDFKMKRLGVKREILEEFGVVSE